MRVRAGSLAKVAVDRADRLKREVPTPSMRLDAHVVNPCRRQVSQYAVAAELVRAEQLAEMIADFAQPRLLAAAADQQLCLPHGDVLEERQRAARGEQPHQRRQQLLDERGRKIVQRQARDDRVVAGLDGQVLDGLVQDADARRPTATAGRLRSGPANARRTGRSFQPGRRNRADRC